uniref:Uncharacterized protein n=3 Tax=Micrurus TaxID=8634 RepID=A0A2D4H9I9_MICLE
MEQKQKTNKAELERMQQEVESQRKETEIVQLEIRKQEENLKKRSFHIENRMKDLLAEKEKFEEERLREQQEIELQKKKQEEEIFGSVKEELQRLQELNQNEKAEKMQIFHELEKLKKEKEDQYLKLDVEKKRLEAQEREQALLVANLEEQLRDKQIMIQLLKRGDLQRIEEEKKNLEDIRESLLRVKEARSEAEEDCEELEKVQCNFMDFKRKQLGQLTDLERDLVQERNHLEKQMIEEQENLDYLKQVHTEHLNFDKNTPDTALAVEECNKIRLCEYRLHHKERQLLYLINNHLPALLEEKQRASEVLDRGLQSLDNTLYEVEKEMEEKEEQLAQYRASASELQQLQETFEFTANVARQEEKVWKKEKEILESRQKQQREALEQAVAKLERRHSALQRHSTLEIEEQKQKLATLNNSCREQTGLQATVEALEQDRENLDLQIQQLKQKIYEGDRVEKGYPGAVEERLTHNSSPSNISKSQSFMPLVDDRINTFIEEEVQRRLQNIQYSSGENNISHLQSTESMRDNERFHNGAVQRKLKYEKRDPWMSFHGFLTLSNDDSKYNQAGEDTRVSKISRQDKDIGTFNPFSMTIQDLGMTQENTNQRKEIEQEYVSWRYPDGCDWNQPKDIKSKRTCSDSPQKLLFDRSGTFDLLGKKQNKSFLGNLWEHKNMETEFDSFSYHHMPASEPIFSSEVQPGASHFWSLQKYCNRISQINQPISDQTLNEKATNEIKRQLPKSLFGSKQNYGLGHLFNLLSNTYHGFTCQEFTNGWFSNWVKDLVSVYHKNEKCIQLTSFIKNCPVIKDVQLDLNLGLKVNNASLGPGKPLGKEDTMDYLSSQISFDMNTVNHAVESSNLCRNDTLISSLVLRQNFVDFSEDLLKLQEYSLEELLQYLTSVLPEICAKTNELKGIYWIAVGNYKKSGPEPACLLLYDSVLYAIIPSTNQLESNQNSLDIFHVFSINTLKEIQIGYAGQSLTLLGLHVENLMKLFTFNKYLTQRICHDIISTISPLDRACLKHPLLNDDLLKLSVDWTSVVTNLILENSVCLSCNFESDLADLLYLLHENMDISKPFLGDIQVVLYTTVKLEGDIRSLVLTNTHIGLIKENSAFCLISRMLHSTDNQSQCTQIQLHSLSELRCVIVPEKENLRKIELAFSKASKTGSSSSLLDASQGEKNTHLEYVSSFCHNQPSNQPYIWRLIFSSDEDAVRLMLHLTGQLSLIPL